MLRANYKETSVYRWQIDSFGSLAGQLEQIPRKPIIIYPLLRVIHVLTASNSREARSNIEDWSWSRRNNLWDVAEWWTRWNLCVFWSSWRFRRVCVNGALPELFCLSSWAIYKTIYYRIRVFSAPKCDQVNSLYEIHLKAARFLLFCQFKLGIQRKYLCFEDYRWRLCVFDM